jgi:hypothetical protein
MKIFQTAVLIGGKEIAPVPTIEYQGGLWLAPLWIEDQETKQRWPARIIRMDTLPHAKLVPPQPWDYQLLDPIPRGVLDGTIAPSEARGFVVIDRPEIQRPTDVAEH